MFEQLDKWLAIGIVAALLFELASAIVLGNISKAGYGRGARPKVVAVPPPSSFSTSHPFSPDPKSGGHKANETDDGFEKELKEMQSEAGVAMMASRIATAIGSISELVSLVLVLILCYRTLFC